MIRLSCVTTAATFRFTQLLREATTRAIPMKYSSQSGQSKLMFADTQDWISDWNASSSRLIRLRRTVSCHFADANSYFFPSTENARVTLIWSRLLASSLTASVESVTLGHS